MWAREGLCPKGRSTLVAHIDYEHMLRFRPCFKFLWYVELHIHFFNVQLDKETRVYIKMIIESIEFKLLQEEETLLTKRKN